MSDGAPPITAEGLTDEQRAVVEHDLDQHATVLAVAGSGKTTAMVHRVRHLIERGASPRAIRAVMFNRAARRDFERKLAAIGVRGVRVQTFNALGHAIVGWAARQGLIEALRLFEDWEALRLVEQAIRERRRRAGYDVDPIDAEEALAAIHAWKGLLTPPDHARCTEQPALVEIYRAFEKARRQHRRMTFDDQIGEAVRLIEGSPLAQRTLCDRLDHLVIDEFQDVNHAQQRLAKLIAGQRARVMVVGDDDQCIYEWRGARSAYIKTVFRETFAGKPHRTYRLTRSFRFGPTIARVAASAIAHNVERVEKPLVAADPLREGRVTLAPATMCLADAIARLVDEGTPLGDMVVLVRLFAQSHTLQARLIARQIPFFVAGERSLLDTLPVRTLRHYLWLAHRVDAPLDGPAIEALEWVVDKPTRYVLKRGFSRVLHRSLAGGSTIGDCLRATHGLMASGLTERAAEALADLADVLEEARDAGREGSAGAASALIRREVDFEAWLTEWQPAEKVAAGLGMLAAFEQLLAARAVPLAEAEAFAREYDTRQGLPPDQCLRITSIFRAKGLEWQRVILPDVAEGTCPHVRDGDPEVENLLDPDRALPRTALIEAERRLFYVAVTRARLQVLVGLPEQDEARSRFIDEGAAEAWDRAVMLVHGVARAGALSSGAATTLRGVLSAPAVHRGLPGLLDRLVARHPGARDALERVRALRDDVPPQAPAPAARSRRPLATGKGTGLPF